VTCSQLSQRSWVRITFRLYFHNCFSCVNNCDDQSCLHINVMLDREGGISLLFSAFPTLGNFTISNSLCPRVGGVCFFFARRNGTKSHYQMTCYLCCHLEIVLVENKTGVLEVSYSFQIMKQLHVLLATHFQHKLMEHLNLWKVHGTRILSDNQALEF